MARIVKRIKVEGHELNALFDTGSAKSYVLKKIAEKAPKISIKPYTVGIGGKIVVISEECIVKGEIEGMELSFKASPVEDIDTIDMTGSELDLSGLKKREFIEY